MVKAGIIDPTKVVRASLMLTTEALVSEIPETRTRPPRLAGYGSGHGRHGWWLLELPLNLNTRMPGRKRPGFFCAWSLKERYDAGQSSPMGRVEFY